MALNAANYKLTSKFERPDPIEPGAYEGRVVQIVDLGLQKQQFKGEEKLPKDELYLTVELLDEFMKDEDGEDILDKPRWISERFTMNSLESENAKSTKRYFALDPTNKYGGDWTKLLGTPCVVTIVNNPDKKDPSIIYDNIHSISAMRAKAAKNAPELVNTPLVFDRADADVTAFYSLSKYVQNLIRNALDFEGSDLALALEAFGDGSEEAKKEVKSKRTASKKRNIVEEDEEEDEVFDAEDEEDEEW